MKKNVKLFWIFILAFFTSTAHLQAQYTDTLHMAVNEVVNLDEYLTEAVHPNTQAIGTTLARAITSKNWQQETTYLIEAQLAGTSSVYLQYTANNYTHEFVVIAEEVPNQQLVETNVPLTTGEYLNVYPLMQTEDPVDVVIYGTGTFQDHGQFELFGCHGGDAKVIYSNADKSYIHTFNVTLTNKEYAYIHDTIELFVGDTLCLNEYYNINPTYEWLNEMTSDADILDGECYVPHKALVDWVGHSSPLCYDFDYINLPMIITHDRNAQVIEQSITMHIGDTAYLQDYILNNSLTYSTVESREGILSVISQRRYIGIAEGNASIKLFARDGSIEYYFNITVLGEATTLETNVPIYGLGEFNLNEYIQANTIINAWTILDGSILDPMNSGIFHAFQYGETTVQATSADGQYIHIFHISVMGELIANEDTVTIQKNESVDLTQYIDSNYTINAWTVTSGEYEFGNVDSSGIFTASAFGQWIIEAHTSNEQYTHVFVINVVGFFDPILVIDSIFANVGNYIELQPYLLKDTVLSWSFEDNGVLRDQSNGNYYAYREGIAEVNARLDSSYLHTFIIQVTDNRPPLQAADTLLLITNATVNLNKFLLRTVDYWIITEGDSLSCTVTNGQFTAQTPGPRSIIAFSNNGLYEHTFNVTVEQGPITETSYAELRVGGMPLDLVTYIAYEIDSIQISVSDPFVAEIWDNSHLMPQNQGEITATLTANNGQYTKIFHVTVTGEGVRDTIALTALVGEPLNLSLFTEISMSDWSIVEGPEEFAILTQEGLFTAQDTGTWKVDGIFNSAPYYYHFIINAVQDSSLIVRETSFSLMVGTEFDLYQFIERDDLLGFTSHDESIAVVNASGLVTAIAEGVVVLTASSDDLQYVHTFNVTVYDDHPGPTGETSLTVDLKTFVDLSVYLEAPATVWTFVDSTQEAVLTENGVFIAMVSGNWVVQAFNEDGSYIHTFHITTGNPTVHNFTFYSSVGDSLVLSAYVNELDTVIGYEVEDPTIGYLHYNATNQAYTYSCDNEGTNTVTLFTSDSVDLYVFTINAASNTSDTIFISANVRDTFLLMDVTQEAQHLTDVFVSDPTIGNVVINNDSTTISYFSYTVGENHISLRKSNDDRHYTFKIVSHEPADTVFRQIAILNNEMECFESYPMEGTVLSWHNEDSNIGYFDTFGCFVPVEMGTTTIHLTTSASVTYIYSVEVMYNPEPETYYDTIQLMVTDVFNLYEVVNYGVPDEYSFDPTSILEELDRGLFKAVDVGVVEMHYITNMGAYNHYIHIEVNPLSDQYTSFAIAVDDSIDLTSFMRTVPTSFIITSSGTDSAHVSASGIFYAGEVQSYTVVAFDEAYNYNHYFNIQVTQEPEYTELFINTERDEQVCLAALVEGAPENYEWTLTHPDNNTVFSNYCLTSSNMSRYTVHAISSTRHYFINIKVGNSTGERFTSTTISVPERSTINLNSYLMETPLIWEMSSDHGVVAEKFGVFTINTGGEQTTITAKTEGAYIHRFTINVTRPVEMSDYSALVGEPFYLDSLVAEPVSIWQITQGDSASATINNGMFLASQEGFFVVEASNPETGYLHIFNITAHPGGLPVLVELDMVVGTTICLNEYVSGNATSYEWMIDDGSGQLIDLSCFTCTVPGIYTVYARSLGGPSYQFNITAQPNNEPIVVDIETLTNNVICLSQYVQTNEGSYEWVLNSADASLIDVSCFISPTPGMYTVNAIILGGQSYIFSITVREPESPIELQTNIDVYTGDTVLLTQYLVESTSIWTNSNDAILLEVGEGEYFATQAGVSLVVTHSLDSMYIHTFVITIIEQATPVTVHDSITLFVDEDFDLNSLLQQEVSNWYNENPTVAGLESGMVWGIAEGSVNVSAYNDDESYVHWFHITVSEDTTNNGSDLIALIIEQIQLLDNHTLRIIFNRALSEADNLEELIEILLRLIDDAPTLRAGETINATILRAIIDGNNSNALVIEIEESFSDYDEIDISIEAGSLHMSDGKSNEAYSKTFTMEEITSATNGSEKVTVYPTITSGNVYVKANMAVTSISVYSGAGRKVATFEESASVSLHELARGNYTLQISFANGFVTTQSVILK